MENDRQAVTCRYTYEGGKHYVTISFGGGPDDWIRVELKREQVADFIRRAFPRVVPH